MKKFALIALMVFGNATVFAQNKWNTEPYLTKSLSGADIKDVFVQTSGGSITVTGAEPAQARIEVYVTPNNSNDVSADEVKQRLEEYYKLDITTSNHELHATAKNKAGGMNWKRSVSISFKIFVPAQVNTSLATSGGSIQLAGLSGEHDFTTSGGGLRVTNVSGKIKGRTSGGGINVSDSKQDIDLVTSGGSITATGCEGNIRLVTSGGSLRLSQLNGKINATTSGGSVSANNIAGELITSTSGGSLKLTQMACSVEAATSAGSIHLDVNKPGKYVKLFTSSGHIDVQMATQKGLDLDLKGSRVSAALSSGFEGSKKSDSIDGKLNGGGIPVTAHASNGSVSFKLD